MSNYLPLNIRWRFTTKEGRAQFKSFFYRIYINIFGIFLRIPILPMSVDFKYKTFDIWYRGTQVICYFKKGKLRYQAIIGGGLDVSKLSEIDKFWDEYIDEENKMFEQEDKEYRRKIKNGLCTEPFCNIEEGEHKKHEIR